MPAPAEILDVARAYVSSRYRRARRRLGGEAPSRYALGVETPVQTFYEGRLFDPLGMRAQLKPLAGTPTYGLPSSISAVDALARGVLTFEVDPERSFFGDCLRVVHAPEEQSLDPQLPPFGWSGAALLD